MFGLIRSSLIDYPGHICAVVFAPGCRLRCPYCHNPQLLDEQTPCETSESEVLDLLNKRTYLLDAVCVSGGEPLLHPARITSLCEKIKQIPRPSGVKPYLIKLDTNGYFPEALREILTIQAPLPLIDYVAMDIKTSREKYRKATGVSELEIERIEQSIDLIRHSGLSYEFRTTVVPGLVDLDDIIEIAHWIEGSRKYVLQQFSNRSEVLDPAYQSISLSPPSLLESMREACLPFFDQVEIRGI